MATIWLKICVAGPETTLPFIVTVSISSPVEGVDEDDREEELCGFDEDDRPPEDEDGREDDDCPEDEDGLEDEDEPDDEPDEDEAPDEEPDDADDEDEDELSSAPPCSNSQLSLSYTSWA